MITYISNKIFANDKHCVEIACLSTDTKPTENIITGSVAIEVDTGTIYLYDEVSTKWNEMCTIKE